MSHNHPHYLDRYQSLRIPLNGPAVTRPRRYPAAVYRREASRYPLPVPPSQQIRACARRRAS